METVSRETIPDPWYVTGLIDGIGTFTYSRSGQQIAVYFAVKLGARSALLEDLQGFFQGGALYEIRGSTYFRITRREELARVLAHFDQYPLRAKQEVYEVWREMVLAKQTFRRPNRERLEQLAAELSNLVR